MENKSLIKTDGIFYKIKSFFKKLFYKEEVKENIVVCEEKKKVSVQEDLESKLNASNYRNNLAKKILNDEVDLFKLSKEELDDMIDYFREDINILNNRLNSIKNNIIMMRAELENNQ